MGTSCLWQCSFIHDMVYCFFSDLFHWLHHINVLMNSVSAQKPPFLQLSTILFSVFFLWYSTFLLCFFSVAKQQAQQSLSFRAKGLQGLDVVKVYIEWIIPIRKSVCWLGESSWGGREEKKKAYLKLLFPVESLLVWTADVCGNSLTSLP